MFYIEQDNKIVLFDEDRQKLQNTLLFMPQYASLEIKKVQEGYVILDFELMTIEEKEAEQAQKEAERTAMLNLTAADVERAIYKAKGMDFDDVIDLVEAQALSEETPAIDIKALKIELKANNFYRGNPYIDVVGTLLGFTKEQLDEFFDTNDYRYLTNCTITINPTPAEAVVTINGVKQMSITVPYGSEVYYIVTAEGYKEQSGTVIVVESETFGVVLEEVENENTADTAE
mgnify:CR=1 FL=1|jgi:hypothetical protein